MNKIKKYLAYNGRINVICADTTELIEKIRNIHDLSPTVTAALGRTVTISAIMGSELKNEDDSITVQVSGDGPIGKMVVVTNKKNELKAYADNSTVDLPLNEDGKIDVGQAVGQGFIHVIKDIGLKEPYIGMVPIISGEIGDDFANYFVKSEGQQAAVAVGVLVNKDGVKSAGGYVVKPMPDATDEDISNIEKSIFEAGAMSKMLDNGLTLDEIAIKITGDEKIKEIDSSVEPIYKCNCYKEKFERGLIALGRKELENLISAQDEIETACHFCNKKYKFSKDEIKIILNKENL